MERTCFWGEGGLNGKNLLLGRGDFLERTCSWGRGDLMDRT